MPQEGGEHGKSLGEYHDEYALRELLVTLLNETLAVELSGDDTTKIGKLIDVDGDFITLVVAGTTGTAGGGGGHPAIHLAFIPFRHIVSLVES